ncbi:MAG: hypothetical protein ACK2TV_00015, partial [Anaerolineales bacterium]
MQRHRFPLFRTVAIFLILITIVLTTFQLISYSRIRNNFPLGLQIGGVPIGGLNYEQAAERIYTVYRSPIEVNYHGSLIHLRPAVLGFEPEMDQMLATADNLRVSEPFWDGFWNYLWDRNIETINIPLVPKYDEARIREYLRLEIASRYDTPAISPKPIPGTTQFAAGIPGTQLNIDRATIQVIDALESPSQRSINLALDQASIPSPAIEDLNVMLKQIIDVSGFDGITEIFLQDLSSSRNLHFAYQANNKDLQPNIAFSS